MTGISKYGSVSPNDESFTYSHNHSSNQSLSHPITQSSNQSHAHIQVQTMYIHPWFIYITGYIAWNFRTVAIILVAWHEIHTGGIQYPVTYISLYKNLSFSAGFMYQSLNSEQRYISPARARRHHALRKPIPGTCSNKEQLCRQLPSFNDYIITTLCPIVDTPFISSMHGPCIYVPIVALLDGGL